MNESQDVRDTCEKEPAKYIINLATEDIVYLPDATLCHRLFLKSESTGWRRTVKEETSGRGISPMFKYKVTLIVKISSSNFWLNLSWEICKILLKGNAVTML